MQFIHIELLIALCEGPIVSCITRHRSIGLWRVKYVHIDHFVNFFQTHVPGYVRSYSYLGLRQDRCVHNESPTVIRTGACTMSATWSDSCVHVDILTSDRYVHDGGPIVRQVRARCHSRRQTGAFTMPFPSSDRCVYDGGAIVRRVRRCGLVDDESRFTHGFKLHVMQICVCAFYVIFG